MQTFPTSINDTDGFLKYKFDGLKPPAPEQYVGCWNLECNAGRIIQLNIIARNDEMLPAELRGSYAGLVGYWNTYSPENKFVARVPLSNCSKIEFEAPLSQGRTAFNARMLNHERGVFAGQAITDSDDERGCIAYRVGDPTVAIPSSSHKVTIWRADDPTRIVDLRGRILVNAPAGFHGAHIAAGVYFAAKARENSARAATLNKFVLVK